MSLAVLITYHDEAGLLGECLDSLAAQSVRPEQILVYDDASARPAEDYIPSGLSVQLLRGASNVGPAVGRNRLLAAARAEWVHFHDADDLFRPGWCERVRAAAGDGVDCVLTEVETVHDDGRSHPAVLGLEELNRSGDLLRFCLRRALLTPSGTYRRARVQEAGGYNERIWQSEDYEFHARLALVVRGWVALVEPLVRVRVRSSGRSKQQREVWRSAWQAVRELEPVVPASHQADLAAFAERVGHQLLQLGDRAAAQAAFHFAETHGLRPEDLEPAQRWLSRWLGLSGAHRVAAAYRALLPGGLRRLLARLRA